MGSSSCANVVFINAIMAYNQYFASGAENIKIIFKHAPLFSNQLEMILMNLLIFPSNDFTVCIH